MAERSTARGRGRTRPDPNRDTNDLRETLETILARLNALEHNDLPSTSAASVPVAERAIVTANPTITSTPRSRLPTTPAPAAPVPVPAVPALVAEHVTTASSPVSNACITGELSGSGVSSLDITERLIGALSALSKVRSNHYYISNFDPSLHDIDSWCEEVERARKINSWDDNECLSRIANCLKGDARSWLNDWVTNDRSWSNFKTEFKPLCTRRIDIANILFDVMNTNSDSYATYSEYARRSILRLNIVKGLSEELMVAIVIRGISDAQVRAAATNAHLLPKDLVEFFSIYTKPITKSETSTFSSKSSLGKPSDRKRPHSNKKPDIKCFFCDEYGHPQRLCTKRIRREEQADSASSDSTSSTNIENDLYTGKSKEPCSFCKKPGHDVTICFAKKRSDERNKKTM